MEFEFWKIFLQNSEKPKADSPNRELKKAEFSKIVPWEARITNSILRNLPKERRIRNSGLRGFDYTGCFKSYSFF